MKIRNGFVSNSSSSSFVCEICGHCAEVYGGQMDDYKMSICENDHVICDEHIKSNILDIQRMRQWIIKYIEESQWPEEIDNDDALRSWLEDEDNIMEMEYDWRRHIPEELCPCCSFENVSENDVIWYLCNKYKTSIEKVKKEIKENYQNYQQFINYLKEMHK
jgi:hypothetical protein